MLSLRHDCNRPRAWTSCDLPTRTPARTATVPRLALGRQARRRCRCPSGHAHSVLRSNGDLADERDDAVVLGKLKAAPASAQPSCREHGFALETDQRPAVAAREQPQAPGTAHRLTDQFAWAASAHHATVDYGERGHGRSLVRAHKKAARTTGELDKSSSRVAAVTRGAVWFARLLVAAVGIDGR